MYKYIVKRLLLMIPTLLGAAIFVFLLLRAVPGDVCETRFAGTGAFVDQEQINICRADLGIDQPLVIQFFDFVAGYATFDLGDSFWTGRPVVEEIALRFELSLQIAVMATLVAIVIAIPLGTISAIRQNTWIDLVVNGVGLSM